MALLTIDREQLAQAATRDTDRQLIRYICDTLAPVLPRLPTQPELVAPFVRQAGQRAIATGFSEGGLYSFHILTDLLLGPYWEHEPFYATKFEKYLDAPGMEQSTRIALAMNAVIETRQELDAMLPKMIDAAIVPLSIHSELLKPEDTWLAFQQIARARGMESYKVLPLFEDFEAGFRKRNALPPIQRKRLSGYDELGYMAQGIPLPKPSDDIHGFTPLQMVAFNASLLLGLIYGSFRHNPLLAGLFRIIDDTSHLNVLQHKLKSFLLSHQKALTENADE